MLEKLRNIFNLLELTMRCVVMPQIAYLPRAGKVTKSSKQGDFCLSPPKTSNLGPTAYTRAVSYEGFIPWDAEGTPLYYYGREATL